MRLKRQRAAIGNVTNPAAGTYRITVPAFTPRGGQATPQFGGSALGDRQHHDRWNRFRPVAARPVQVLTFSGGAAPAASNVAFYVELYR